MDSNNNELMHFSINYREFNKLWIIDNLFDVSMNELAVMNKLIDRLNNLTQ